MLLFQKLLIKKCFCNWTLIVKKKKLLKKKTWKCFKAFTRIELHIFIYNLKCKLENW